MSGRFEASPDLLAQVAKMVAPEVRKVAKEVERVARRLAPAGKRWVSMADNNVRDTHRAAHKLTELPANLRFAVPKQPWDAEHELGEAGGIDHLLKPKDTSTGLPIDAVQHVHCRCELAFNPAALASKIKAGPAVFDGRDVTVHVTCVHPDVLGAEYGEDYGTGVSAPGTYFMQKAAARVAGRGGYGPTDAPELAGRPTVGGEDN